MRSCGRPDQPRYRRGPPVGLAGARRLHERALRIEEAAYGPDHPQVAMTLGNLGSVVQNQGDLAKVRQLQERALRLFEAAYGPDHPDAAIALTNLGSVLAQAGEPQQAILLVERALCIFRQSLGD